MRHKYSETTVKLAYWFLPSLLAACAGTPTPVSKPVMAATPSTPTAEVPVRAQPQPVAAPAPDLRADAPLRYVVEPGDTLWDIAGYFLADPWYWPELWYANAEIANPHLIYPGDVLELVWVDGRPRLRRSRPDKVQRLSPQVRELALAEPVTTIDYDAIRQFLDGPRLVSAEQLAGAPYVIGFLDQHLIGSAGNELYMRYADPGQGRAYALVRPGQTYRDPETDALLGYEAIPVGSVAITAFGDISTGIITDSEREALVGDRLLPIEDARALAGDFYPHAPAQPLRGRIIAVFDGVSNIGQYLIVTLNLGSRGGVERGHVLDIYQTGRSARDPFSGEELPLPPLEAGTLMVFDVEPRISFALVMRATRAIHVFDRVRNPQ